MDLFKLLHCDEKDILQLHFNLYVTLWAFYWAFCKTHRDFSLTPGSFTIGKNIKKKIVSVKTQQYTPFCKIFLGLEKYTGNTFYF